MVQSNITNFKDRVKPLQITQEVWEKLSQGITYLANGKILCNCEDLPELDTEQWKTWERVLKIATIFNQVSYCPACGLNLNNWGEQHHALISRKDVQGRRDKGYQIIHHSYNVVVVHSGGCHEQMQREDAWKCLCDLWTEEEVRNWYSQQEKKFKSSLRKF